MRNAPLFVVVLELFLPLSLGSQYDSIQRVSYALFLDEEPHEFLVSIQSVDVPLLSPINESSQIGLLSKKMKKEVFIIL
jgi:hypothetical protein